MRLTAAPSIRENVGHHFHAASPAVPSASGAILDSAALAGFRNELKRLHQTFCGEAVLESVEPNVRVRVTSSDGAGHLLVRTEITPDHRAQGHWFEFEIDQSDLPAAVAQIESVLAEFPVKGISD